MPVSGIMGVRTSSIVGSVLLAMCCFAAGAAAFDTAQSAEPAGPSGSSSFGLPSFLDTERLPNLQEAWRAQITPPGRGDDGRSAAPAFVPPLYVDRAGPADRGETEPTTSSARTATVRRRAEELSRRFFGGGASTDKPAQELAKPAVQPEVPLPAQPVVDTAKAAAPLPPPYAIGADPSADRSEADTTTAALPDAARSVPDAPMRKRAAAAPMHVGLPPLPRRRPEPDARAENHNSSAPSRRYRSVVSRPSVSSSRRDAKREVFPSYLHSFGWDPRP